MSVTRWTKSYITVSGTETEIYPAQVDRDNTWNGWAAPRFTLEVARRIAQDVNVYGIEEMTKYGKTDQCLLVETREGESVVFHEIMFNYLPESKGDAIQRHAPDADGMYHIGSWSWTWSEMDFVPIGTYAIDGIDVEHVADDDREDHVFLIAGRTYVRLPFDEVRTEDSAEQRDLFKDNARLAVRRHLGK